jgi:hypothetical protein
MRVRESIGNYLQPLDLYWRDTSMAKVIRRKGKRFSLRFRKKDIEHNLLVAVTRWVRARGGNLLVVGGISVQDWHEGMGKFKIAVNCLGAMPRKEKPQEPTVQISGKDY